MRKVLSALAFSVVGLAPIAASADVASEARFFDELGRRAYDAGQYEKAFETFLLVQEIAPSHRVLYNIAVCADLAGKSDVAFVQYRDYLASGDPDGERRTEAEQRAKRLERRLALVEITSDPPGAAIYVDRKELGEYGATPRTISVASGERRVTLERPGYSARVVPVVARIGAVERVSISLEPRFGEVAIDVIPPSATLEFLRDEKPIPFTAGGGRYRLPVGPYTVVARAPGYVTARDRLVVGQNDVGHLALGLEPLARPTGRLLVAAGSASADLYVDGRRVAVTPATLPDVTAGEHMVEVRLGARVASRRVTIEAGHATYVELSLGSGAR